jgi:hypothetical protein
MADSNALRTRRARRHKAGDHSLCLPERCPAVGGHEESPEPDYASEPGDVGTGLGVRGQKLWSQVLAGWSPAPMHRELLLEACRVADRLEKLDRQLRGEDWLRFRTNPEEPVVYVYVDKVLTEAREQENTFKALVLELAKVASQAEPEKKGGGVLVDLAAELKRRQTAKG